MRLLTSTILLAAIASAHAQIFIPQAALSSVLGGNASALPNFTNITNTTIAPNATTAPNTTAPVVTIAPTTVIHATNASTTVPPTTVHATTVAPTTHTAATSAAPTTVATVAATTAAATHAATATPAATVIQTTKPSTLPAVVGVTAAQQNASVALGEAIAAGGIDVSNLATCNVIDPTRKEAPWHGSNSAFPQVYDANTYVCVDGNFLCPSTAPLRCAYGCYTSSQYYCQNGQLYQAGQPASPATAVKPTTPATTAGVVVANTTAANHTASSVQEALHSLKTLLQ